MHRASNAVHGHARLAMGPGTAIAFAQNQWPRAAHVALFSRVNALTSRPAARTAAPQSKEPSGRG